MSENFKKKRVFTGAATALITPFTEDGINYPQFERLINWQIESGIDALVICGTSGEASTMTDDEHRDAIRFAVKTAAGRVPIIAGTGSNDLSYALDLVDCACSAGADAVLSVTPYYNKATQNGLIKMYNAIADRSTVPVILYNVPSRTGVNIEPATYEALAEHENIVGIKEANGNMSKIVETMARVHGRLDLYSGNDDQIVPLMALGGVGCISVLSNLLPGETSKLCHSFLDGDIETARNMQYKYHDLIDALFCEVNPIPVKAAMSAMGFCDNILRLPLTEMESSHAEKLYALMREQGINV
ncbi:MAG: 4-hydroxy-tetrahydrodipicolinate synthase [Oscillospiraceae bacterium]|nr:4-hydroxy-tetrahydrodipicolinate synthase [Oscillospiraceae bacterium]MDD7353803.1 4-hydroxy-tetrahydrodipicolinate synthase [Oscillospiraceae bacterium]MDY3937372.1 4-hydroxy-tetrahydrodipicolinate synthase [Oscillospiraceae bacterium]